MKNRINLDDTDRKIVSYLQKNPAITHSKIAEHLELSQPAIGARIKKLTKRGIIATQIGINFQKIPELHLVRLNLKTTRPADVIELSEFCPFVINALKSTGDYNMTLFLASRNLKHIDSVIDRHYRSKSYVSNLQMDLVTSMNKPVIFPLNLKMESVVDTDDPCAHNPYCRNDRAEAGKRTPEEIDLF